MFNENIRPQKRNPLSSHTRRPFTRQMIDQNIARLESGELLTEFENKVFHLIVDTCNAFEKPVIARVAGGWVRDKLLGKQSDDIDVAVEGVTGLRFAEKLQSSSQQETSKLVVIEANPDQSKHLETARVCLFSDFWMDFCGLRSDTYADNSRIPQVSDANPNEDAHRRDFTVNALFFNINSRKVEDFVGGIPDLKAGILRTPLDPSVSFMDDPLRILRAFRFASRLGFELDPSLIPAAAAVVEEFRRKITRERISSELHKALEGNEPHKVIHRLVESKLFGPVFDPASELNLDEEEALKRVDILASRGIKEKSIEVILSAVYAPIVGMKMKDPERRNKIFPSLEVFIVRRLRLPTKISDDVITLLEGAKSASKIDRNLSRREVGWWVRHVGPLWPFVHLVIFDEDLYKFCVDDLYEFIHRENLGDAWELKPLVNGVRLAEIHGIKPGKQLKEYIDKLIDWQLENPVGTAEDYELFVKGTT